MTKREKIELFRKRFINRSDVHAVQHADQSGRVSYTLKRSELTDKLILEHVDGKVTLGAYADSKRRTKYLVIDIDNRDEEPVRELLSTANSKGLAVYVENSGRRGFHIWLWFDRPTPCNTALEIGNRLLALNGDGSLRSAELYPSFRRDNKVGTLVKLAFGVHQANGQKCLFLHSDFKPFADQWSFLESIKTNNADDLLRRLPPIPTGSDGQGVPKTVSATGSSRDSGKLGSYPRRIKPCVIKIIENGSDEGERNRACHIIATECRANGQTPEQAFETLTPWFQRNRMMTNPFTWSQVQGVVKKAYERPMEYGCGSPTYHRNYVLDKYCASQDRSKGDRNCAYYAALKKPPRRRTGEVTPEEVEMEFANSGWQYVLTPGQNLMYRVALPKLEAIKGVRPGGSLLTHYRELSRWTGLSKRWIKPTIVGLTKFGLIEAELGNWGKERKATRIRRVIPPPEPPPTEKP